MSLLRGEHPFDQLPPHEPRLRGEHPFTRPQVVNPVDLHREFYGVVTTRRSRSPLTSRLPSRRESPFGHNLTSIASLLGERANLAQEQDDEDQELQSQAAQDLGDLVVEADLGLSDETDQPKVVPPED